MRSKKYKKKYSETLRICSIITYDPSKTNCNASEFFDLSHTLDSCLKKEF